MIGKHRCPSQPGECWMASSSMNYLRPSLYHRRFLISLTNLREQSIFVALPFTKNPSICSRFLTRYRAHKLQSCRSFRSASLLTTQLGLKGWVRNRRDGSIEVFSGDPDKVFEMGQRCRRGAPDAMVTGLQVFPSDDDPGNGFERRPTV